MNPEDFKNADLDSYCEIAGQAQAAYNAQPFRDNDEIEQFQPDEDDDSDWVIAANVEHLRGGMMYDDIAERVPNEQIASFISQSFALVPKMANAIYKLTAEVRSLRAARDAHAPR